MRTRLSMLLLITTAAMTTPAWGKQVDLLPHELVNTATHVVVGDVVAVYERRATEGDWKVARYLAELRVSNAAQGDGIVKSDLIYTRCRQRRWAGKGRVPWTTSGHHGLPSEGDTVRVYLARHVDDGFHRANHDGGLNVMGANGFEQLKHVTIESRPQLDVCTGTGGYIRIRGNLDALLLPSVGSLFPIEIHWHRVEDTAQRIARPPWA